MSIVKNGWGLIFQRYSILLNTAVSTGSILAMLPSFIEGNLYGGPRPHIPLSGEGRVVAGFIPASVGDKPRPYYEQNRNK